MTLSAGGDRYHRCPVPGAGTLIIQIPCFDEEDQLPVTLAALPRHLEGFDRVEWLVVDDGSTDRTVEVAREHGVQHIVRLRSNQGLAHAFQAGLDAALKLGADVVVNTDADNQYQAGDIGDLVAPILAGQADVVVGERDIAGTTHFSPAKKRLQRLGSAIVRRASGTEVPDATSGFRAYSRDAALSLTVVSTFTYTLESLIQAGKGRLAVASVPVGTNPELRGSRLFASTGAYVRRNALAVFRIYASYEPLRVFSVLAGLLGLAAVAAWTPFLWSWIVDGQRSGHVQSVVLGGVLASAAVQALALGVLADLIAAHRQVSQRTLERVRRLELAAGVEPSGYVAAASAADPSH